MNKKQFYRLTIVLTLPFLMLSWWLSQQDFVLERGQSISCDVEGGYCDSVFSFPVSEYKNIDNHGLRYSIYDGESIIFLRNFTYPIGPAYFLDHETQKKVISPSSDLTMTASRLEEEGCRIRQMHFICENSSGDYSFKNIEDSEKFDALIVTAKEKLNQSNTVRLGLAASFFMGIFFSYLIISMLVKFIAYGVRKKG